MKRQLFIGSSSDGLGLGKLVKEGIESQCGSWLECHIWNNGDIFQLNKNTLECLVNTAIHYDYAVFIATAIDNTFKKKELVKEMRDNVLFEAGLFTGSIGTNRTFILYEEGVDIPTDLIGITRCEFRSANISESLKTINSQIELTKNSFGFRMLPSASLAVGYFDNFIKPVCDKYASNRHFSLDILIPNSLSDIDGLKSSYLASHGETNNENDRPIVYRYKRKQYKLWDIPTTLRTIYSLVSNATKNDVIGESPEKSRWIEHELSIFVDALMTLIKKYPNCSNVNIKDFNP